MNNVFYIPQQRVLNDLPPLRVCLGPAENSEQDNEYPICIKKSTSPWCTCTAQWVISNPSPNNELLTGFIRESDTLHIPISTYVSNIEGHFHDMMYQLTATDDEV
ncbi:4509_t:CDS:2, partial [Funneliformis caledonium]